MATQPVNLVRKVFLVVVTIFFVPGYLVLLFLEPGVEPGVSSGSGFLLSSHLILSSIRS